MTSNATLPLLAGVAFLALGIWILLQVPKTRARKARAIRTRGVVEPPPWDNRTKRIAWPDPNSARPMIGYTDALGRDHVASPAQSPWLSGPDGEEQVADKRHRLEYGQTVVGLYDPKTAWIMLEHYPSPVSSELLFELAFTACGLLVLITVAL